MGATCCSRRAPAVERGGEHHGGVQGSSVDSAAATAAAEGDSAASGKGAGTSAAAVARAQAAHHWLEERGLLDAPEGERQVGLVYDEAMLQHAGPQGHPEQPARLSEILSQLGRSGLLRACRRLPTRQATEEELQRAHAKQHVERVFRCEATAKKKAKGFSFPFGPDTYVCEHTPQCARMAAGSLLGLVDAVLSPQSSVTAGMAVVRPPGHHANSDRASGFCLFNNVGVAARHIQEVHGVRRVAIVDWDVHHGNGTSDLFAEDESVLLFSMHRWEKAGFFPGTGSVDEAGRGDARGYTVNVPLEKGYGNADVEHVFKYVLCPLLDRFKPEAILVSAGFDAVKGDPLGECRVSPEGFGWMTRALHRLARHFCEGRLVLCLEGGYNPDMIGQCCVECVLSLLAETLGEHLPASSEPAAQQLQPGAVAAMALHSTWASAPTTPASSAPGTPKMGPLGLERVGSPPVSPVASRFLDHTATPKSTPPHSPHLRPKVKAPSTKTVRAVRQLTELHHILPLQLPLAPKQQDDCSKNARKKERRRLHSEEEAASSDSSWAIACGFGADGEERALLGSPGASLRLTRQVSSEAPSEVPELPELELPALLGAGDEGAEAAEAAGEPGAPGARSPAQSPVLGARRGGRKGPKRR